MAEYSNNRSEYGQTSFASVSDNPIDSGDIARLLPRQVGTGSLQGTQTVGYGNVKIDGSNNRIQLEANSTKITLGDTSDSDGVTGVALTDSVSGKKLVSIGRDTSTVNTITGLTAYDSTETRRLLAGTFPDGSVKIKLSQATFDVATATDDQLIWSSDFNLFKIAAVGTATVVVPSPAVGSPYTTTVTHGIGGSTAPAALVFVADVTTPGGYLPVPYAFVGFGASVSIVGYLFYEVTPTTIAFSVGGATGSGLMAGTWTFKYYLLKETAS